MAGDTSFPMAWILLAALAAGEPSHGAAQRSDASTAPHHRLGAETMRSLESHARHGILFVGDSPVRRIYVRAILQLRGLTDDDQAAESFQNTAKLLDHARQQAMYAHNLTDTATGEPFSTFSDARTGARLDYVDLWRLERSRLEEQVRSGGHCALYIGAPYLHVLFNPLWETQICDPSFSIEASTRTFVREVIEAVARVDGRTDGDASRSRCRGGRRRVLFGSANAYTRKSGLDTTRTMAEHLSRFAAGGDAWLNGTRDRECMGCIEGHGTGASYRAACTRYAQLDEGVTRANALLEATVREERENRRGEASATRRHAAELQFVDMHADTAGLESDTSNGGHFGPRSMDAQLTRLVDALSDAPRGPR